MPRITPERLAELNCSTITDREIRKLVKAYRKAKQGAVNGEVGNPWIDWGGGNAPDINFSTVVDVKFRDKTTEHGKTVRYWWGEKPEANNWWHEDVDEDIIAYRIVQ